MNAKEYPILFSAPMVRAILNGTKTQTRRVFAEKVSSDCVEIRRYPAARRWHQMFVADKRGSRMPKAWHHRCPYGEPGDRLWVRETFAPCLGGPEANGNPTLYRADQRDGYGELRWKPSIFMPRWASRITLELDAVRVERLQEISESDAIEEGIQWDEWSHDYVGAYRELWDSLNAKRGLGWSRNPFVWVLSFHRI